MKPICYECQYRREIPGDSHSSCAHPSVKQDNNPFAAIVQMLSGANNQAAKQLEIRASRHGILRGWFMWPANFDPVWLENCNGFTPKAKGESL